MMKKYFLFIGLLFYNALIGQNKSSIDRTAEWGDYYFINGVYEKAIAKYLSLDDKIPDDTRRNLAGAYAKIGDLKKAEKTLQPLVDSNDAAVIDYYRFASYLTENKRLRDEYRRKALKLPIENTIHKADRNYKSPYKLVNLESNTSSSEFGAYLIEDKNNPQLIYAKKQSKKYNRGLKNKIKSKSDIYNLYGASFDADQLKVGEQTPFPQGINSAFQDGPASWDPLTNQFYLTRSSGNFKKKEVIQLDLYVLDYSPSEKKIAQPLNINMIGYSTMHPAVSSTNRRLYFSSDRPGGFGGMDLYYSTILPNNQLSSPINLGPDINTTGDEVFPFVYDEKFLFYSSKLPKGNMKLKLAINTVDIRWDVRTLPNPFNNGSDNFSFYLKQDLDYGFLSSNRPKGKGKDDLYVFRFTPQMKGIKDEYRYNPIDTLIVSSKGVLVNDNKKLLANDPLSGLFPKKATLVQTVKHGSIKFNSNGSFLYKNNAPLREIDSFSYVLSSKYGKSEPVKVLLRRSLVSTDELPKAVQKTFLPIYYNYNETDLLLNYKNRVDAVVASMNANPNMVVEISSFSDCRGKREYNLKLSEQRNQTIINYIRSGIDKPARVFGKGYGEDEVKGNTTKDYLILGGSFNSLVSAKEIRKKLIAIGYQPKIKVNASGMHQVIIDETNSLTAGNKISDDLKNKGIKNWVSPCGCCQLSEEAHQLNRKTEFKIINF